VPARVEVEPRRIRHRQTIKIFLLFVFGNIPQALVFSFFPHNTRERAFQIHEKVLPGLYEKGDKLMEKVFAGALGKGDALIEIRK